MRFLIVLMVVLWGSPIFIMGFRFFYGITYSIVDITYFEIDLGGVAVVINIEIVGV
jgi:hypothetical protein